MTPTDRRVTMREIAELAGVTVPTVSRVLNGQAGVAPTTRTRVELLIADHGYHRNRSAPMPLRLLELVVDDMANPWTMDLIRGADGVAHEYDLGLVVTCTRDSTGARRDQRLWRTADSPPMIVDGSHLLPMVVDQPESARPPLVLVEALGGAGTDLPTVAVSAWTGGLRATEELLSLGHHRIAVISGPRHLTASRAPLAGHRVAMELAGRPVVDELLRWGEIGPETGRHEADVLLALPEPPTAIITGNDGVALGVLDSARRHGLDVPGDLSVLSLGDTAMAAAARPPLTTVRQPYEEMSAHAARTVIALARGDRVETSRVEFGGDLVIRRSTAPPPVRR